jgi:hypothetical protein
MLQRPIAVDWAVTKKEYEEKVAPAAKAEVKKEEPEEEDEVNDHICFNSIQAKKSKARNVVFTDQSDNVLLVLILFADYLSLLLAFIFPD